MTSLDVSTYGPWTADGQPKALVFLLHGYGANKEDLIPLAYSWSTHLPEALFISLNAPTPVNGQGGGRQWFSLQDKDPNRLWTEMAALTPLLRSTIDKYAQQHQIPYNKIALAGFSQGAALALNQALYQTDVAGALAYSGWLVPSPQNTPPKPTPTCLVHGDQDPIIPLEALHEAQKVLKEAHVPFEAWVSEGLGHGMSPFGLEKGHLFLQRCLRKNPA